MLRYILIQIQSYNIINSGFVFKKLNAYEHKTEYELFIIFTVNYIITGYFNKPDRYIYLLIKFV